MLLGSSRLEHHGRRLRLHTTERDLEIVLAARFRSFNCRKLRAAGDAVGGGFELTATNPDATHRGRVDSLIPETGVLSRGHSSPHRPPHGICGKPKPILFETAFASLGAKPMDAVKIGDNSRPIAPRLAISEQAIWRLIRATRRHPFDVP
jgi:ribonucleotide monophosphatase NagD (HAD superfamily)